MSSFDPNAASQITVDPELNPKPSRALVERRQQLIRMFMAQGFDEQRAKEEADRYLADYPVVTGQQVAAPAAPTPAPPMSPRESTEADLYNSGLSADEARKQADLREKQRAERERREFEDTMHANGYGLRRAPGPVPVDGSQVQQGAEFATPEEAEAYYARPHGMTPAGYGQSEYDRDLERRGLVYRYDENGQLGLSAIASDDHAAKNVPYGVPGAPGRLGKRPGLEAAGWTSQEVDTPSGKRRVYVPTDEKRAEAAALRKKAYERQQERNPYSAQNLPSVKDRMQRFQAQIQLGGGRITPQAIQLETMLNGMDPAQRQRALQYMAPGGALAAQVDARNLDQAARLAGNAIVGAAAANPATAAAVEAARRKADPAAAGAEDVSNNKYDTPEAQTELNRLAASYDTTWLGFSYEDERALAAALQKPPYNMPQAEAEATAYRLAERRRTFSGNGPAGAGRPTGTAAPLPPGFTPPT